MRIGRFQWSGEAVKLEPRSHKSNDQPETFGGRSEVGFAAKRDV